VSSQVSVINQALSLIGADPIMDINENSKPAKFAKILWDDTRDALQRLHPWKCCLKRQSLALMNTAPISGWSYQYTLPTNPYCLRVLQMEEAEYTYTVEGRALMTDETEAKILYIGRVEDVVLWDALLRKLMSYKLSADLAYPIAASATLAKVREEAFVEALKEARSIDGMEGPLPAFIADDWINARI
jgi:hypothetical protein